MKPLDGLLVLDLTRLLPGALLTQTLANFGAEVWKIEAPGRGDYARDMPPLIDGSGAYFLLTNFGKKSIALNLKHEDGRKALLRLASQADILVEGFRPGVMERLGLGYEQLSAGNRRLIYVALTGYGQDGPCALQAGHDLNYAALAGLLHPSNGLGPSPMPVQLADVTGAQHALSGILLALLARERTGQGQKVDVSLLESLLPLLTVPLAEYAATGDPGGAGLLSGKYACYHVYRAGDGQFLALAALEEKFWSAFCNMIDRPSLVQEQYVEDAQPKLISELADLFRKKAAGEWLAFFKNVDTCLTVVNDIPAILANPQLKARGAFAESHDSPAPPIGALPKLSHTPGALGAKPPRLGEHTREILTRHGFSDGEISDMAKQGAVQLEG